MQHFFTIHAGGINISFRTGEPLLKKLVMERYSAFATDAEPEYVIDFSFGGDSDLTGTPNFEITSSADKIEAVSLEGHLEYDVAARRGRLAVTREHPFFPIENALRILFARVSLERSTLLVHAAGIKLPEGDGVAVFCGPSGAGKSTLAEHALKNGLQVIGDDLLFIIVDGDGISVESSPFAGSDIQPWHPGRAPLAMLGYISGQGVTTRQALSRPRGAASLVTCVPFMKAFTRNETDKVLGLADRITGAVDSCNISFALDGDITELLRGS